MIRDVVLFGFCLLAYNLYWRWLSVEQRFIKRNKLEPRHE